MLQCIRQREAHRDKGQDQRDDIIADSVSHKAKAGAGGHGQVPDALLLVLLLLLLPSAAAAASPPTAAAPSSPAGG